MPNVNPSELVSGVYIIELKNFGDSRGYFRETYRKGWVPGAREMIQGNTSFSRAGVLRGLHYHLKQADLWTVTSGHVRAALFDARASSPTFRAVQTVDMRAEQPSALYIPRGVAHGFYAVEDTFLSYLVDELYDNTDELGILWNDPDLGVDWGTGAVTPTLSPRDAKNPRFSTIAPELLPG